MGLEISAITNTNLQKLAKKVDNGDNILDQDELSNLLVKMMKKKYSYEDAKALMGLELSDKSNEEKAQFYTSCLEKLNNTMKTAEAMQKRENQPNIEEERKKDQKTITAAFGGIGAILASRSIIKTGAKSLINGTLKVLGGTTIGTGTGLVLALAAVTADKLISKNQQEKLEIKNEYLTNLNNEIEDLINE